MEGVSWLVEGSEFREGFLGDRGDLGIRGRVARDEQEEGSFVFGAMEDGIEEVHGTWGVGEGCDPAPVKSGDEETASDADGFGRVIVFQDRTIGS